MFAVSRRTGDTSVGCPISKTTMRAQTWVEDQASGFQMVDSKHGPFYADFWIVQDHFSESKLVVEVREACRRDEQFKPTSLRVRH